MVWAFIEKQFVGVEFGVEGEVVGLCELVLAGGEFIKVFAPCRSRGVDGGENEKR